MKKALKYCGLVWIFSMLVAYLGIVLTNGDFTSLDVVLSEPHVSEYYGLMKFVINAGIVLSICLPLPVFCGLIMDMDNRMKYDLELVGENIKYCRLASGMSQEVLAKIIGRSKVFISNVEQGRRGISLKTLSKIADTLDVSLDCILRDITRFNE